MKWVATLIIAVQFAGCTPSATPLGDPRAHPAIYEDAPVTVRGVVTEAGTIPLIGTQYYTLKDKTGSFIVITSAQVPDVGETLRITARLRPVAELAGVRIGLHLIEVAR